MENYFNNQIGLFLMYLAGGILVCLLYDIFRALRKSMKTPDYITYIEDTLFWIIVGTFLVYLTFIINSGDIRFYTFVGLILGGLIYYFTISKYFVKILVITFTFLKKIIEKLISIILAPLKLILKFNKKIICVVCINLQNVTNNFKKFFKFTKNNKKVAK